ncbi:hypothetical protein WA158_005064 [Blastocystis sp. Blastoise]
MIFLFMILFTFLMETQAVTLLKTELHFNNNHKYYYTNINVGSQESPARMIIDTSYGSSYVYAKDCVGCYYVSSNPYYKYNSSTLSPISCGNSLCQSDTCHRYSCRGTCHASTKACCSKSDNSLCAYAISFLDNTIIDGSLIRDNIMIQTATGYTQSYPTTFGYIDYSTRNNYQADGILGLGYRTTGCDPSCINTYLDDMVENINGVRDMFTICFGNTQGVLTYGGIDEDLYSGNITWVDFIATGFYTVELNDFRVNENHFFNSTETMLIYISSLPYVIRLQSNLYDALVIYLKTYYCYLYGICKQYSIFENYCLLDRPSSSWPTIDIYLNDIHLSLSSGLYFQTIFQNNKYLYCFVITREDPDVNYSTFGASFMRGFTLIHDRGHNRIGIATPTNACHAQVVGGIHMIIPTPSPTSAPSPTPAPVEDNTDVLVIILISCSVVVVVVCGVIIIVTCCRYYKSIQQFPTEESKADHKSLDTSKQSSKSQELPTIHSNQQSDSTADNTTI